MDTKEDFSTITTAALPDTSPSLEQRWRKAVLTWYEHNKRELPWRGTKDPYRIWISEIILQQTRVAQGYDYYLRFIRRFPDVFSLAATSEDEVLHLWQGLGYYSRARNLHTAAQQVARTGKFPDTYTEVRKLKGIGDYTAAAICSIAYGQPHAVVDGNVYRVLARYFGIDVPIDTTDGKKVFTQMASQMMDLDRPGTYNQAIMDFGAIQCTPASPLCGNCPLASGCHARQYGSQAAYPVKSKKTKITERYLVYLYLKHGEHIYLHRRGKGDIWQGLYEPFILEYDHAPEDTEIWQHPSLSSIIPRSTIRPVLKGLKHQLTHRRLVADCYIVQLHEPVNTDGYFRIKETDRPQYAVPRLISLMYEKIDETILSSQE